MVKSEKSDLGLLVWRGVGVVLRGLWRWVVLPLWRARSVSWLVLGLVGLGVGFLVVVDGLWLGVGLWLCVVGLSACVGGLFWGGVFVFNVRCWFLVLVLGLFWGVLVRRFGFVGRRQLVRGRPDDGAARLRWVRLSRGGVLCLGLRFGPSEGEGLDVRKFVEFCELVVGAPVLKLGVEGPVAGNGRVTVSADFWEDESVFVQELEWASIMGSAGWVSDDGRVPLLLNNGRGGELPVEVDGGMCFWVQLFEGQQKELSTMLGALKHSLPGVKHLAYEYLEGSNQIVVELFAEGFGVADLAAGDGVDGLGVERVERAWRTIWQDVCAGLNWVKKSRVEDVFSFPDLLDVRADAGWLELDVHFPAGIKGDAGALQVFCHAFGVSSKAGARSGDVSFRLSFQDFVFPARFEGVSAEPDRVLFGVRRDGGDVAVDLSWAPHLRIAGATGSGKSSFLLPFVLHGLWHGWEVSVIDASTKQAPDFRLFDGDVRLPGKVVPDDSGFSSSQLALFQAFDEVERVFDMMEERHGECGPDVLVYPGRRVLLIIDEFVRLGRKPSVAGLEKDDAKLLLDRWGRCHQQLVDITGLGRTAGVMLIGATQNPTADSFGPSSGDFFQNTVGVQIGDLGNMTQHFWRTSDYGGSLPSVPGRLWVGPVERGVPDGGVEVQGLFVEPGEVGRFMRDGDESVLDGLDFEAGVAFNPFEAASTTSKVSLLGAGAFLAGRDRWVDGNEG